MFRLATRRVVTNSLFRPRRVLLPLVPTYWYAVRMSATKQDAVAASFVIEATGQSVDPTVEAPKSPRPTKSDHPIVWIDCEMSGLNPGEDKLLQVACFITDAQLNLLDPIGFETVVSQPKVLLDTMDEWCTATHAANGLTARVLASNVTPADASKQLLAYIKSHVPEPKKAILAGNSVHFDKEFLRLEMPEVVDYLHYRIGDVSSIKEFAKRWWGEELLQAMPKKLYTHEAKQDILESIEEARYYRRVLFKAEDEASIPQGSDLMI